MIRKWTRNRKQREEKEKATGATEPRLDLVANEQHIVFFAEGMHSLRAIQRGRFQVVIQAMIMLDAKQGNSGWVRFSDLSKSGGCVKFEVRDNHSDNHRTCR